MFTTRSCIPVLFALSLALSFVAAPVKAGEDYEIGPGSKLEFKVNIWGQVKAPGKYNVEDGTNLLELISSAGGPTDYANLKRVRVTRTSGQEEKVIRYDLHEFLKNPGGTEMIDLMPNDTVYIPKNSKAAWREFIKFLSEVALIINTVLLTQKVMV